jgi:type I restriction enzyme S subunit
MNGLPRTWVTAPIGDLGLEVRGSVVPSPGATYELYSVPTFPTGSPEVVDGSVIGSAKRPVVPGDVLLCKINPRINRVWIVSEPISPSFTQIASTEYLVFRVHLRDVSRYLMWFLRSPRFRDWIELNVEGATGSHTRAKSASILRQPVPIAPANEQRRIVAAIEEHLSRLDAAVRSLTDATRKVTALRNSILRSAIDGWPEQPLGEFARVFVGATPSRRRPELWGGEVPWVSSGEVAFGRIARTRESIKASAVGSSDRLHPPGTVLLGMIGEGKTRGQAAILDIAATHNQNSAAIRLDPDACTPEWLFYVLMARYEVTRRAGSGGQQPALNRSRVEALEIPLPPLEEQAQLVARIETRLSSLDVLLGAITRSERRSDSLRRTVLQRAFAGDVVAQDPSDEPASVLLDRIRAEHATAPDRPRRRGVRA